jgi:hypothetical protein
MPCVVTPARRISTLQLHREYADLSRREIADRAYLPLARVVAIETNETEQPTEQEAKAFSLVLSVPWRRFVNHEWVETGAAHVCGPGVRHEPAAFCRCGAHANLLCDGPYQGGTCDEPLCAEHATEVGPDRHLCARCA